MSKFFVPLLTYALAFGHGVFAETHTEKQVGILLALGDIANCGNSESRYDDIAKAVGLAIADAKMKAMPIKVIIAGDLAYKIKNNKTGKIIKTYAQCWAEFTKNWDGMKEDILPIPGNHDDTDDLEDGSGKYYAYFADFYDTLAETGSVGGNKSYIYQFPRETSGQWAIIGLNYYRGRTKGLTFIEEKLPSLTDTCILGFSHPPYMSSGHHGRRNDPVDDGENTSTYDKMSGFLNALTEANAAVFIAGHDHSYEQFNPLKLASTTQGYAGIRQFVAGTGGVPLYSDEAADRHDYSEFFSRQMHGYLKLELFDGSYNSVFVSIGDEKKGVPGGEVEATRLTGETCFRG